MEEVAEEYAPAFELALLALVPFLAAFSASNAISLFQSLADNDGNDAAARRIIFQLIPESRGAAWAATVFRPLMRTIGQDVLERTAATLREPIAAVVSARRRRAILRDGVRLATQVEGTILNRSWTFFRSRLNVAVADA